MPLPEHAVGFDLMRISVVGLMFMTTDWADVEIHNWLGASAVGKRGSKVPENSSFVLLQCAETVEENNKITEANSLLEIFICTPNT